MRVFLRSKIHRARVTDSNPNYEGSITIDRELMQAADILEGERVLVADITNGERLETYVIQGAKGVVCMNGAAAKKIKKGDIITIMSFQITDRPEKAKKILLGADNTIQN